MSAIQAMVKNGRIETDEPLGLPDGTKLLVIPSKTANEADDDWDDTPEGIANWLKWHDSLQPLIFTDEERAALEQYRKERKEWELAHADEYHEKLRKLWE